MYIQVLTQTFSFGCYLSEIYSLPEKVNKYLTDLFKYLIWIKCILYLRSRYEIGKANSCE